MTLGLRLRKELLCEFGELCSLGHKRLHSGIITEPLCPFGQRRSLGLIKKFMIGVQLDDSQPTQEAPEGNVEVTDMVTVEERFSFATIDERLL